MADLLAAMTLMLAGGALALGSYILGRRDERSAWRRWLGQTNAERRDV